MGIFLSTFLNKRDKKGRVSVPASFRAALSAESFQGVVVYRSLTDPVLDSFGMSRIEKLSSSVNDMSGPFQADQEWASILCADAQQLSFDSEGRIMLPEIFLKHAQIEETVAFVGRGPLFQIWNPDVYHAYQEKARADLLKASRQNGGQPQ